MIRFGAERFTGAVHVAHNRLQSFHFEIELGTFLPRFVLPSSQRFEVILTPTRRLPQRLLAKFFKRRLETRKRHLLEADLTLRLAAF